MEIIKILCTLLLIAALLYAMLKKMYTITSIMGIGVVSLLIYSAVTGTSVMGESTCGNHILDVFEYVATSFTSAFANPGLLIVVRLYMGVVYSVCGSATMTLAGDVLPVTKVTQGISRFAFTVSIGMAVGPFVGLQVQSNMDSRASFLTIFGITILQAT